MTTRDPIQVFLSHSHNIVNEARFAISSFPNAEVPTVERIVHQLYAIRTILHSLDDPHLAHLDVEHMLDYVDLHIVELDRFLETPPAPIASYLHRIYTGRPGRPSFNIDVQRLCLLHDLGNSWESIAEAYGVNRTTLYRHLQRAGISPERKEFSQISDTDLDEIVAKKSLEHPFIGSAIMMGHLEAMGVHIPRKRVQDSLRRVDILGVLTRCAAHFLCVNIY